MALNKLSQEIHNKNVEKGFYDNPREIGTTLMLVVSELSEALEADRKNRRARLGDFESRQKHRNEISETTQEDYFKESFETYIKDTFEDEIADTMIRLFDICGHLDIDIEKHIKLKTAYNELRPHKHGKGY